MARPRKTTDQSQTISVSLRIDPKIKFAIDLLAREQKRTITGVLEWSVMQSIRNHRVLGRAGEWDQDLSLFEYLEMTWSPIEAHRVAALGAIRPQLLTYEESCIFEVIRSIPQIYTHAPPGVDLINYEMLDVYWPLIKERAITVLETGSLIPVDIAEVVENWKASGLLPD